MSWSYAALFAEVDRQERHARNGRVVAALLAGASIAEAVVNADGRNALTASTSSDPGSAHGTAIALDARLQPGWIELLARVVARPIADTPKERS